MKFPKIISLIGFLLLLYISIFSQVENSQKIVYEKRIKQLKSDLLQEIKNSDSRDQVYYYVSLGKTLYEKGYQKEGLIWLNKAIEIGLNPSTKYKNSEEKLSSLWNLMRINSEEDIILNFQITAKLKEFVLQETKIGASQEFNKTLIHIAWQLGREKKYENLAYEFALLSLKGKELTIEFNTSNYFFELSRKNPELANKFFYKLLEIVKTNQNISKVYKLVNLAKYGSYIYNLPLEFTDSQKKDLISLFVPYVQEDAEKIRLKKVNDCSVTKHLGVSYLDDYKRLLPEKLPIIQQAIDVCRNSHIEPWKKLTLDKIPLKTSQDILDYADKITDKKIQANYLSSAAYKLLRDEKNYDSAIKILDSIEKDFRDFTWSSYKIEAIAKILDKHYQKEEFVEIENILINSPQEFRPFIIVQFLQDVWFKLKQNQSELVLNLMNQARNDFNKIETYTNDFGTNPTKFNDLTMLYVKFGFYEEAIVNHQDSIYSLNRILKNLPDKYKNKTITRFSPYSKFTNSYPRKDGEFIDKYYDQIYKDLGQIQDKKIRLTEYSWFFQDILEKLNNTKKMPKTSDYSDK